ncbi:hypothetical protein D3C84_801540 [compost metagenome]
MSSRSWKPCCLMVWSSSARSAMKTVRTTPIRAKWTTVRSVASLSWPSTLSLRLVTTSITSPCSACRAWAAMNCVWCCRPMLASCKISPCTSAPKNTSARTAVPSRTQLNASLTPRASRTPNVWPNCRIVPRSCLAKRT